MTRNRSWILLLALSACVLTYPASARSLVIEAFHADLWVQPDGSLIVTETISPRFTGSWNGIFRSIPIVYQTPREADFRLQVELLRITDDAGRELKWEESRRGYYKIVKIWIPEARDTVRTVILRYRVDNALQYFEEHDELYWNVTGDEWDIPIEQATAEVHLLDGTSGVRTAAYLGPRGSTEQTVAVQASGEHIAFKAQRPLQILEGLTVAVAWDPGFVERPSLWQKSWRSLKSNSLLLIPLAVFAVMYWVWRSRGKDPPKGPLVVEFAPPADLTPSEVGTLSDNQPDMRDLTATFVDLAVRGYLRIDEVAKEQLLGLWSSTSYRFHRTSKDLVAPELRPYEKRILNALFEDGSRSKVDIGDLKNKFYKEIPPLHNELFEALVDRGYYSARPDKVRRNFLLLAGLFGVATFAGIGIGSDIFDWSPLQIGLAGFSSIIILAIFAWIMPARTQRGARVFDQIRGFEEFLLRVESERYKKMITGPEMFERFLPYAMALGLDDRWAKAFQEIYLQQPGWYHSSWNRGFSAAHLASSLGQMASTTGNALASSPRSSGGSSFGGGGSCGGGFGGGGGGGF